jgi:hypothetical protein
MCRECRAPAPSSHLCRQCAGGVGATEAIPLDFGLFATPAIATRAVLGSLGRLLTFNVLANLAKWVLVGGTAAGAKVVVELVSVDPQTLLDKPEDYAKVAAIALAFAVPLLLLGFFDIVLIPAADIVILDGALRKKGRPFFEDLRAALARAFTRKGTLLLTFAMIVGTCSPALLLLLPFLLISQITGGNVEVVAAGKLLAIPVLGTCLGAFGLAIPAVILEHRSAAQAIGRAWSLSRLQLRTTATIGTVFVIVALVMTAQEVWIGGSAAPGSFPREHPVLVCLAVIAAAFVADVAWPAILVAAYHGLVAEEARLVGRRS